MVVEQVPPVPGKLPPLKLNGAVKVVSAMFVAGPPEWDIKKVASLVFPKVTVA